MAIITISRGCFSHGKEIAEKVAQTLGYECVSREILIEASRFFHVPEMRLLKSIHDAPTILERMTRGREKYLSYIQAALLEHVKRDKVVYHGNGGHLLLPEISHVLKVRVIAELEERIRFLQQRKKVSRDDAIAYIQNEDRQRADWTRYLFKTEVGDPLLYDVVLKIGQLNIQDACELICTAARSDTYLSGPESRKAISDLAISSHVRAALQDICEMEVTADGGTVRIKVEGQKLRKTGFASERVLRKVFEQIRGDLTREIVQRARKIPGVEDVECDIDPPYYS